jgi:LytS/YehU family sensor histidine kinase
MLGEEVQFLYDYFSLLQIRYGEAVRLKVELGEDLLDRFLMLPISLQVLAENVVKHNEFNLREPLEIRVWLDGGTAAPRLGVRNRIARKEVGRASSGVGLANLDERCKLAVGAALEVVETEEEFVVYLPVLQIE